MSGISEREEVANLRSAGASAVLVGKGLSGEPDPAAALKDAGGRAMTLVKICGLRSESELEAASCADFLGFVVEADSKGRLRPDRAKELMALTCNRKVMVTTCKDVDRLLRLAGMLEPNVVQLNTVLPEAEMHRLRTELGSDLWALFPVAGTAGPGTAVPHRRALRPDSAGHPQRERGRHGQGA